MLYFENELAGLKQKLLTMASHAETAVRLAVEALVQRDDGLAERVKTGDQVIDRYEVEIDDLAIHLLSKAPLASKLRLITVAMKVSQNLERVGDEATKIAKRVRELNQEPPLKLSEEIPPLSGEVLKYLQRALDCFVQLDSTAARELIPLDKQIDEQNRQIHRQLSAHMIANPEDIPRCLHLMVIAKSLERVADHAKNVAEEVVYLREAQDIRHPSALKAGIAPAGS
jgi:phosphate transport system protein